MISRLSVFYKMEKNSYTRKHPMQLYFVFKYNFKILFKACDIKYTKKYSNKTTFFSSHIQLDEEIYILVSVVIVFYVNCTTGRK